MADTIADALRRASEGAARAEALLAQDGPLQPSEVSALAMDSNLRPAPSMALPPHTTSSELTGLNAKLQDMGSSIEALHVGIPSWRPKGSRAGGPSILEKLGIKDGMRKISLGGPHTQSSPSLRRPSLETAPRTARQSKSPRQVASQRPVSTRSLGRGDHNSTAYGDSLLDRLLTGVENQDMSLGDALGALEQQNVSVASSPPRYADELKRMKAVQRGSNRGVGGTMHKEASIAQARDSPLLGSMGSPNGAGRRCSNCEVLCLQVKALVQSLTGLGAQMFNWSSDLSTAKQHSLADLVLEYVEPCSHIDEALAVVCSELQRLALGTGRPKATSVTEHWRNSGGLHGTQQQSASQDRRAGSRPKTADRRARSHGSAQSLGAAVGQPDRYHTPRSTTGAPAPRLLFGDPSLEKLLEAGPSGEGNFISDPADDGRSEDGDEALAHLTRRWLDEPVEAEHTVVARPRPKRSTGRAHASSGTVRQPTPPPRVFGF